MAQMNIRALTYRLLGYKTIEELFDELKVGKRNSISEKELDRGKKLSKALLPSGLFYPSGGEVFEALQDVEINYLTHFMAPYTGGEKAKLLKGERVKVSKPTQVKQLSYYCYPINASEIENRIIPFTDKDDPAYNGYSLSIDTKSLNNDFKKIELMPIKFIKGDATNPTDNKTKIIVHICNDVGGWGKGFVMAISKRWKLPELEYRNWHKSKEAEQTDTVQFERLESRDKYSNEKKFELGNVQFVKVSNDIWIANMIAQRGIKADEDGIPPIRYSSVSECLERVRQFAKQRNASVHMPRIGCGLAGGQWSEIEEIVDHNLIAHEIETTVYDFE
jgi:O-acetyl-ADP-ribose deacetylase (regulator of RNase III)